MADRLLPVAIRLRLGPDARLVARPGSPVVHVAVAPSRRVTPGGRLRRGTGPVCGTRGNTWVLVPVDARGLCQHCRRKAATLPAIPGGVATIGELAVLVDTAPTGLVLDQVVALLCQTPGALIHLTPHVRSRRHALHLTDTDRGPLPVQRARGGGRRRTWWQQEAQSA